MAHIGIFGGSFNPIHLGHTALAEHIVNRELVDEVWLMVSPHNPLKPDHSLLDENERLTMARLSVKDISGVEACDFEFHLPRPSYTYHTLQALQKAYPQHRFSLIIGADNWDCFDRWYKHDEILHMASIIIYPRPGYSSPDVSTLPSQVQFVNAPLYPISSTEIRNALQQGLPTEKMLHPEVARYIAAHTLYNVSK